MSNFVIKNLETDDLPALMQVQQEYARQNPGVQVLPAGFYLSPAFHNGNDVFCVYHPNGQMLGFSVVYAQLAETIHKNNHTVWAEVKVLPAMNHIFNLRDLLLEQILKRTKELTSTLSQIPVKILFQYFPYEKESLAFIQDKGFTYLESVYLMQRDLNQVLPSILLPSGFKLEPWRLETQEEREQYVKARNECFPESPISLEEWIYFMSSPTWTTGTNFAAFKEGQLVGCLTAYWDEEQNKKLAQKVGYTEYIFVCPPWRRKGIATAMIAEGLQYLKHNGIDFAELQVKTNNREALQLYEKLGFAINQESGIYSRQLTA
jgi:ribosomal protein S18 acetylase RimI-like enzyme